MKVKPRKTGTHLLARRITAPETKDDKATGKKIPLLSFIDQASTMRHFPTTKEIFLYAAGTTEEGEISDGLDRLTYHDFVVHLDENPDPKKRKAIGLDVVPNRSWGMGVKPVSQEGVKTVTIQYALDGAVARVIQRPTNFRSAQSIALIRELDKLITAGKTLTQSVRVGGLGTVVSTTDDTVEIRPSARAKRRGERSDKIDEDDLVDEEFDDEEQEAAVAE